MQELDEQDQDDADEDTTEGVTVNENVTQPDRIGRKEEVDVGVPPPEALFINKSAWRLSTASTVFDILTENSYDAGTRHLADHF